jgi:hypothetical protein
MADSVAGVALYISETRLFSSVGWVWRDRFYGYKRILKFMTTGVGGDREVL